MYIHSDPSRESDPHAQPNVEVLYISDQMRGADILASHAAGVSPSWEYHKLGFYYAFGFPGCLWDSDPVGPFDTEAEAIAAAREGE